MFTNLAFTNWGTTLYDELETPQSSVDPPGPDGRGQLAGTGRHSGFPAEIHQARPIVAANDMGKPPGNHRKTHPKMVIFHGKILEKTMVKHVGHRTGRIETTGKYAFCLRKKEGRP